MNESIALLWGTQATRSEAQSALPNAPVVPEPESRERLTITVRARLGVALQTLGRWVEPTARGTVSRVAAES